MKILKSWLNDWIDLEAISTDDISQALESVSYTHLTLPTIRWV